MKKIILSLIVLFGLFSCDDNLEGLNVDEKNPSQVPAYTLFTSSLRSLSDQISNSNVNRNNFRLTVQYWTQTTYTDESNYDFLTRKVSDNIWSALYAGTLADLNKAKSYINAEVVPNDQNYNANLAIKKNKLALIDLMMAYTYQVLVDTFGDIPYSQALGGSQNFLPKYDNDLDIYKDLISKVNTAIANMNTTAGSFGNADVIYHGDVSKWKKFANGLLLKLGVNLLASGQDNILATTAINNAITSGLFTSNADNCKTPYMSTAPNQNQVYVDLVASGRHDFVVAKPFVDKLIALNDPRRPIYTDNNPAGGNVGGSNSYNSKTHPGDLLQEPDYSVTLMDYAEIEMLLAEAAERGIVAAGSAETHYNNAITASMQDWGVVATEIATYLAQPTVAYTTATGTWEQKIGEQAWLMLYNRGVEGWNSWKRLDFPVLTAPASANAAAEGKVPVRMAYPVREQTLNPSNYNAAATAIGGDKLKTKVFWDIN